MGRAPDYTLSGRKQGQPQQTHVERRAKPWANGMRVSVNTLNTRAYLGVLETESVVV